MMKQGAIVLLSGGMDSAFCLHWALANHPRVWALFVDYGQRNLERESLAARRVAAKAQVELSMYDLRFSWQTPLCSSLPMRPGTDVTGLSNAFVPGRNLLLLTIAAVRTLEVDATTLV